MVGFIVKSGGQEVGRIEAVDPGSVCVRLFGSGAEMRFAMQRVPTGAVPRGIVRIPLPVDSVCQAAAGECRIVKRKFGEGWKESHRYEVEFTDGRLAELPEAELTPVVATDGKAEAPPGVLEALLHQQQEGYSTFHCREELLDAYLQTSRAGLGVRALLSSRIDLRPHQAYVAGVVLLDRQQRYLLADEVGLGKTIEAGIVIHDLLGRNPEARVLVITPAALVRQWLCELFAKFCGHIFRVPELSNGRTEAAPQQRFIFSYFGAKQQQVGLLKVAWDLVVIDEAHHLVAAPELYLFVRELSRRAKGLLLLSALPAQHREEEYLRLLALLEPDRYAPDSVADAERFRELYARQQKLGSVLRWISRKLPEISEGEREPEEFIERLRELAEWPVLENDHRLRKLVAALDGGAAGFVNAVEAILHHIGDTHRINRRILRNRRARLIEKEELLAVLRRLNCVTYVPDGLEASARDHVLRLLREMRANGLALDAVVALTKLLGQACSDPQSLTETLALPDGATLQGAVDREALSASGLGDAENWEKQAAGVWKLAEGYYSLEALAAAQTAAGDWKVLAEESARFVRLVAFLKREHAAQPRKKLLLFAGFPGLAARLFAQLREAFGNSTMARFHAGMPDLEKEIEVRNFRRDRENWLMVCDETGGEGRNFQFADELVHYDLPWDAARVEQRIGRLDRLGRENAEVVSHVLCAEGSEEEGIVAAFADGLEIFTRSISGLEFALREVEGKLVRAVLEEGGEAAAALAPEIRESAARERAEDEGAELFDEGSNERRAAESFRRAQSTAEREQQLERAFVRYFQHVAPGRQSVQFLKDANYPEGIVRFVPDDLRTVSLPLCRDETTGRPVDCEGTFSRSIAQERPDLQFFSVGHPLFDALCGSLFTAIPGRTYAIETTVVNGPWRGFEFAFRVVPGGGGEAGGLANQLQRIFEFRLERVWVRDTVEASTTPEQLLAVRRRCKKENKDAQWWNLTKEKSALVEHFYVERGWSSLVSACHDLARELARQRVTAALAERMAAENARIEEQQRQLASLQPPDWREESAALDRLREAINGWSLELDHAGFLSVRGGVYQRG